MPEFLITMFRDLADDERDRVAAAGLRATYVGHDLPVEDAIPVITIAARTSGEARERLATLLDLSQADARRLRAHRRAGADGDGHKR